MQDEFQWEVGLSLSLFFQTFVKGVVNMQSVWCVYIEGRVGEEWARGVLYRNTGEWREKEKEEVEREEMEEEIDGTRSLEGYCSVAKQWTSKSHLF